jgi:hypothetical protein
MEERDKHVQEQVALSGSLLRRNYNLKRLADPEKVKYYDQFRTLTVSDVMTKIKLTDIPFGVGVNDRSGNQITIIGYQLSLLGLPLIKWACVKIVVIRWLLDTRIQDPISTDIYSNLEESGVNAFFNFENKDKFSVQEQMIALLTTDHEDNPTRVYSVQKKKQRCDMPVRYMRQEQEGIGHMYMMIHGSDNDCASLRVNCRLYYLDS